MKYNIFILYFITSCSSVDKTMQNYKRQCSIKQNSIEARHASLSIKADPALKNCFKNYLRFQKEKKQVLHICHSLNIKKDGKVSFSSVKEFGGKNALSNDFKMCLEQALWAQNLKSLQLSEKVFINFPITYQSL
jgi:hypothetical protein